jgi:hypothetical protein
MGGFGGRGLGGQPGALSRAGGSGNRNDFIHVVSYSTFEDTEPNTFRLCRGFEGASPELSGKTPMCHETHKRGLLFCGTRRNRATKKNEKWGR